MYDLSVIEDFFRNVSVLQVGFFFVWVYCLIEYAWYVVYLVDEEIGWIAFFITFAIAYTALHPVADVMLHGTVKNWYWLIGGLMWFGLVYGVNQLKDGYTED